MKILKVIVDELPSTCAECQYCEWSSYYASRMCLLIELKLESLEKVLDERPNWCPLWLQVPEVMSPDELPILNSRIASGDIDFD